MWFFLCRMCHHAWTITFPNNGWEGPKYCPKCREDAIIFIRELLPGTFFGIWEWDIPQVIKDGGESI
jgi:hypothetical protein